MMVDLLPGQQQNSKVNSNCLIMQFEKVLRKSLVFSYCCYPKLMFIKVIPN